MFFQGVADVFKFPDRESIVPTEEQEEVFIRCVLEGKPFTQTVTVGNVVVVFTTPTADEYPVLHSAEKDLFADYLFVSNIQSIRQKEQILYLKESTVNFDERIKKLTGVFKDSIVLPLIVGYWYKFRELYNKLFEMAVSPDFFERKRST